ncbi:hypothetical protein AAD001_01220 [Colwelliaceae bacterium 6471]
MIKLPTDLNTTQVDEYKSKFIEYVDEHENIEVSDRDVEGIDTIDFKLLPLFCYIYQRQK